LRCVTKLHILECHFIVPSSRCTCIMIILFNKLLDNHPPDRCGISWKRRNSLTGT
jgi:hypothetical protein